jgi:hypothetical protein
MKRKAVAALAANLAVFLLLLAITVVLQIKTHAYQRDLSTYGDEAPHYLNSLVIRDYLVKGLGTNPMVFALRYYAAYPKIALFVWPPLFHAVLGLFMVIAGTGVGRAMVFIALCSAGVAFTLFRILRRAGETWPVALAPPVLLTLLSITQHLSAVMMLDCALALVTLLFVIRTAAFLEKPDFKNALWFAFAAAAGCLIKGNGVANLAALPFAIVILRRWDILRRWQLYAAAAIIAVLSVIPLAIAFAWLRENSIFTPLTGALIARALRIYLGEQLGWLGLVGLGAGLLGLALGGVRWLPNRGEPAALRTLAVVMLGCVLTIVGFHLASLHSVPDSRYLYPAVPCMFFFLPEIGRWLARRTGRAWAAPVALWVIVAAFLAVDFHVDAERPAGYRRLVADLRRLNPGPLRVLVFANDRGEGAFVVEVADSDPGRRDCVIRSTKLMMISDWHSYHYKMLDTDPVELTGRIERLGIQYLVLDHEMVRLDELNRLIRGVLAIGPGRVRPVLDFPADADHTDHLEVFQFLQSANPPAERLELTFPFAKAIVGDRKIYQ